MSHPVFVDPDPSEPEEEPIPLKCRPSEYPSPAEALAVRLPDGTFQDLGFRGGGLEFLVEGGGYQDTFEDCPPPDESGIYCFIGHYWSRRDYWGEYDCGIDGAWRIATAEDCYLTTDDDPPSPDDTAKP